MADRLAAKVRRSRFKPSVLIGVSRGGLVPVRILSDHLGIHNLGLMRVEFYTRPGQTAKKPRITQPVNVQVRGQRVLLVDDISDSGKSLTAAIEHLRKRGAKEVRVATIHHRATSLVEPHFFVKTAPPDTWINYPWEHRETERKLKQK